MQNRSTIFAKNGIIISSKADQNRSLITQNGPSNAVVKKLQMLALASRKKVIFPDFIFLQIIDFKMESDVAQMKCENLDSLFIGSTKWFDVLVNLKEMKEAKLKMANETGKNKHRLEIPDWSPVKLVIDTYSRALGHSALFFADEHNQETRSESVDELNMQKAAFC